MILKPHFHSVRSYREQACGLITFNSLIGVSANGVEGSRRSPAPFSSISSCFFFFSFFSFCFAPKLKPHTTEDHAENEICQSKTLNHSSPAAFYQNMTLFISNMDLATFHPVEIAVHNSEINRFIYLFVCLFLVVHQNINEPLKRHLQKLTTHKHNLLVRMQTCPPNLTFS